MSRICKTCKKELPLSEFRAHCCGYRWTCRNCENADVRRKKPWRVERKRQYQRERRNTHRGFALVHDARIRAAKKGCDFDLDWRDIQARIDRGACEVTGIPFTLDKPKHWTTPSIDRIDSSGGYVSGNVQVVLYGFNTMRNEWGIEPLFQIVDAIRANQQKVVQHVCS